MSLRINGQKVNVERKSKRLLGSLPTLLFCVGAMVTKASTNAKVIVRLSSSGKLLKTWNEKIGYAEVDGAVIGEMYDAFRYKNGSLDDLNITFEVDDGTGPQALLPTDDKQIDLNGLQGVLASYVSGKGVSGSVSILFMSSF